MSFDARVLDEVAATAEAVAASERRVARNARVVRGQRRQGMTWSSILDQAAGRELLTRVRNDAARMVDIASRLVGAVVAGLADEHFTRREIAARLGVTHQRVSSIVRRSTRS